MNVILSSVSFRSFQPNTWFASRQFEMCEYVGNRTGTLSLVNMSIAILFAGRNNLLIVMTGWNQKVFLTLHRWAARVATLQAVVHSIAYTIQYEPIEWRRDKLCYWSSKTFLCIFFHPLPFNSYFSLVLFDVLRTLVWSRYYGWDLPYLAI